MDRGRKKKSSCIICFGGTKSSLRLEIKLRTREIRKWGKDKPRKPQKKLPDYASGIKE